MSRQVDLGQIVPNIQVGTTTTGSPSSQASVENVGTDLNPILNFTIPKGDAGAIKMIIVQELPQTGQEDTIYLVPLETPESQENKYAEYVYIDNAWELLGKIGIEVDLTDYYTKIETNSLLDNKVGFTDYATNQTGGVIKKTSSYGYDVNSSGYMYCLEKSYSDYGSYSSAGFISKGTLENVITGKGLVSNTDYATDTTSGVVITSSSNGIGTTGAGNLYAREYAYSQYQTKGNAMFISKGTLENVLTERIGDIQTLLDNLNTGSGV